MDWFERQGSWILLPPQPKGILHFLGGAFVATAPQVTYARLLEALAHRGYLVIATPFINTFDHRAIADEVHWKFERALRYLTEMPLSQSLPIYGIGHSMGCKLHLLMNSEFSTKRAGNIFISFNNFSVERSIPFADRFAPSLGVQFTPTPSEFMTLVEDRYSIPHNLLIQFTQDTLDQSDRLAYTLRTKFPNSVTKHQLPGTHVTPMGPELKWNTGQLFSPWDAVGQWVRQSVYQDLQRLEDQLLLWLDSLFNKLSPI